jgi:ankyrin repeat protein
MKRPHEIRAEDFPIKIRPKVKDLDEILPLIILCASGKLYEVEEWIAAGKPIQCLPSDDPRWRKLAPPLQTAADRGFHSLAALLLVNGYDPNGDEDSPLSSPVRSRNHSMVSLLLAYGTDPCGFDFCDALETYDREMMDRLIAAGANPCLDNAVARALRSKARPLLGFVKSHREQFPCLQRQVDIALNVFVENRDEKGVALMLWLGANPHARVPCSPYPEDEARELDYLESPFERALWISQEPILKMLLKKPIPADQAQYLLHRVAYRGLPEVVRRLLEAGANPNHFDEESSHILDGFINTLTSGWRWSEHDNEERGLEALRMILEAGARWPDQRPNVPGLRRDLLHCKPGTLIAILRLFKDHQILSEEQLHELTLTPAMKKLLQSASPSAPQSVHQSTYSTGGTTSNSGGYWKKHWSQR